jgi:tRNA(fMet)-specific endonuclease VapC
VCQYILDTDHVSFQELFNGWVSRINEPSQVDNLPALYTKLWATTKYLQTVEVLDFTPEADKILKQLLKNHPPLGNSFIA